MSVLGGLEHLEPFGGIARVRDDEQVQRLGAGPEYIEAMGLALKVLLKDDHSCTEKDHEVARDVIKVISYPTLIVSSKEEVGR